MKAEGFTGGRSPHKTRVPPLDTATGQIQGTLLVPAAKAPAASRTDEFVAGGQSAPVGWISG